MKLFIDVETTGFNNPRMVQIGAFLCEDWGQVRECYSSIIQPEGFEIPSEASATHGITTEIAKERGRPLPIILERLNSMIIDADLLIAHNVRFDYSVIANEYSRTGFMPTFINFYCTMLESTQVCKLPTKNKGGYKWPKLAEAYMFFFNEKLYNAHDALTDVLACRRIYFEGLQQGSKQSSSQFEGMREAVNYCAPETDVKVV